MEHLRLGRSLGRPRDRRRIVLAQPLRRYVVGIEPDGPLALAEPLRALARQRSLPTHGGRLATPRRRFGATSRTADSPGSDPKRKRGATDWERISAGPSGSLLGV